MVFVPIFYGGIMDTHVLLVLLEVGLDFVKSLAWPILTLIALFIFKEPLKSILITRGFHITRSGIEVKPPSQQKEASGTVHYEDIDYSAVPPAVKNIFEERIAFVKEKIDQKDLTNTEDKISLLIRQVAGTVIAKEFEEINGMIFQSQVDLLTFLNGTPEVTEEDVLTFYDKFLDITMFNKEEYPLESFLKYIKSHELISQVNNSYRITDYGKTFLLYLEDTGRIKGHFF